MVYDITDRVHSAREYFDGFISDRIAQISRLSGVPVEQFKKINPVDFLEKNKYQRIDGYEYRNIRDYIVNEKTDDRIFLVSPVDAVRETAAQVSYKSDVNIRRTIRASKCEVCPCPTELAQDFFVRNHRQTAPLIRKTAVCFGLVFCGELVAVMLYDISNGAVRGKKQNYELVRLAISRGTRIHGGASKLQAACEDALRVLGVSEIYSYSNATINSGAVYERLGFVGKKIERGQPFVVMNNNKITRLVNLTPISTDKALAAHGWLQCHLGGNKIWYKNIAG